MIILVIHPLGAKLNPKVSESNLKEVESSPKTKKEKKIEKIEKNISEGQILEAFPPEKLQKNKVNKRKENVKSVEVEPICNTTKITVSNIGFKSCSKLNCLSKSNSYHRSCYKKLMFHKLPSSEMI